MTTRKPRPGDRYVIRAARTTDGKVIPGRWLLTVDPNSTDDTVVLPSVYFQPKRTHLGITRKPMVQATRTTPLLRYQPVLRFNTQRDALAACRALQAHFAQPATRSDVTA